MDSHSFNVLSLCTGIAGVELGIRLAVPESRAVCCVEHEAYAIAVLEARMQEGWLDDCPIWTDLKTFDGKPWRGLVDLVTGGYPCQPFSIAGKRRAEADPRHLWPYIARIIREVEPEWCFFENVANHLQLGYREVRSELENFGYSVTEGLFTAAEVGASHKRERLFILAHSSRIGNERRRITTDLLCQSCKIEGTAQERKWCRNTTDNCSNELSNSNTVADARCVLSIKGHEQNQSNLAEAARYEKDNWPINHSRKLAYTKSRENRGLFQQGIWTNTRTENTKLAHTKRLHRNGSHSQPECQVSQSGNGNGTMGYTTSRGSLSESNGNCREQSKEAIRNTSGLLGYSNIKRLEGWQQSEQCSRYELPAWPPSPTNLDEWRSILAVAPTLEPAICYMVDGASSWLGGSNPTLRTPQLRALGNAVIPLVAAFAYSVLRKRF